MSDRREQRGRLLQLSTQESCDCTLDNGSSTKNLGKVGTWNYFILAVSTGLADRLDLRGKEEGIKRDSQAPGH